ncbi:hypothetical protein BC826DRAFT_1169809 [Russula brevipes]|nr:hypothetical protein BC826DRAFT_1169809 [Russula brevipes]
MRLCNTPCTSAQRFLLKAEAIAEPFLAEVKTSLANISRSRPPKLVGILATANAPMHCLGIEFELREVGAALGEGRENDGAIIEANADDAVDGIMDHYLQQIVSPFKDVEGLNYKFHYNLYHKPRAQAPLKGDVPPPGTVKSILPCTPLGVVKALERIGVYNALLPYGDRAYGRTITVINRSEVVGRPLAALLANDGARVFSVDIDSTQEYTKRPAASTSSAGGGEHAARRAYHTHHVIRPAPADFDLARCLSLSDVVVSAVPSAEYKVPTAALKDGCVCMNVAADKNFGTDVRDKASLYIPSVGKVTILMLLRNLLRLLEYQDLLKESS